MASNDEKDKFGRKLDLTASNVAAQWQTFRVGLCDKKPQKTFVG